MKKFITSIMLICYLTVTCGLVINQHYCMDRLNTTQFFAKSSNECGKCGMHTDDSNGCCRDEVKVVKLVQDQNKIPVVEYSFSSFEEVAVAPSTFFATSFYNIDVNRHFHNHSPPLISAQDTYLQINVFRI